MIAAILGAITAVEVMVFYIEALSPLVAAALIVSMMALYGVLRDRWGLRKPLTTARR